MAKAQLEIVVVDKGGSGPVGQPAPAASGSTASTRAATGVTPPPLPGTPTPPPLPSVSPPRGSNSPASGVSAVIGDLVNKMKAGESAAASGSATAGVGAVARLASAAGPAGIALGAVALGAGATVYGLKRFVDNLHEQAQRLSSLSGPLAGATARSEVREMLAEMRRAEKIGPELARFEDARSRVENAIYDLMTQFWELALKVFVPVMEAIARWLDANGEDDLAMDSFTKEFMGIIAGLNSFGSMDGTTQSMQPAF